MAMRHLRFLEHYGLTNACRHFVDFRRGRRLDADD
jgi:hypothetical protein